MNFENLINKLSNSVPEATEETYVGEDGLQRCSVCGGKLETIVRFAGIEKKVRCVCECTRNRIKEQQAAAKLEYRKKEMRKEGFLDSLLETWTFENDDNSRPNLTNAAKNYVKNFEKLKKEGKGLLFYGNVGTGKTYIAACIANALVDQGIPVLMTNFARISNILQENFNGRQAYLEKLNEYDLIVIDDLAAERRTEYMQEIVFNVIDSRYRSGLPMIITTNLTAEELKKPTNVSDTRIYDRIIEKCFPIEVKGTSHRRAKVGAEYEQMKGLLGL